MKIPFRTIAISEGKAYSHFEQWKSWMLKAVSNGAEALMIREPLIQASELKIIIQQFIELDPLVSILINTDSYTADLPIIGFHHKSDLKTEIPANSSANTFFGKSCHSLADVLKAQNTGYDYVFLSPIFYPITPKKELVPPLGLEYLNMVCKEVNIPVFALGGVSPDNADLVMQNGAYGWAGIGSFLGKKHGDI